jgi:ADP-ribose pyrophosphatase YjhB (NUDIX family)
MKIATNGIVTNEAGQVLLIQRDDSRTFAPPGGSMETGELLTENVAREVREETGLIVMPVRLVGVFFWPMKPEGMLNFVFRCIQRGGEITPSEESPQVDYFWPRALPEPMMALHRERLERGLFHQGGPVYWGTQRRSLKLRLMSLWLGWVVYPRMNRARKQQGRPDFVPAPQWQVTTVTIIRNKDNQVLWLKSGNAWRLPGGKNDPIEAPWETAVRHARRQLNQTIQLTDLSSVASHPQKPELTLAFTADSIVRAVNSAAWFTPGSEPDNSYSPHKQLVAEASRGEETAVFRVKPAS